MASFSFLPRLMRKRVENVEKSEAILALLDDSFQCISNGKPEQLFYLYLFSLSNLMESSVVYGAI